MSGRVQPHYGFQVTTTSMIPCVEVTDANRTIDVWDGLKVPVVVKRVYGITTAHAINRALKWMRANGDPR